jgi:folate-dependent phosphoribosylglycinamide formyltransferase PurN
MVSALQGVRPELCLLGDCGIVPPAVLTVPTIATLNAHPGILPDFRGLDTPLWAVLEERFGRVGCTLHVVDAGIDTGPILETRPYEWRGDETIDRLMGRLDDECLTLLAGACRAEWPAYLERAVKQGEGRLYSVMPLQKWLRVERKLRRMAVRPIWGEWR